jgi:flagellar assembly factor FliW
MAVHTPTVSIEEPASGGSDELPTIEFVAPLPGFPAHRSFALVRVDDAGLLYSLTSVSDPGLRFLVVPPAPFFPDYAPEVDDDTLALLDRPEADHLLLLLVVTAGEEATTANLLAPIVLDQGNRRAVQAVLTGSGLPVREPFRSAD